MGHLTTIIVAGAPSFAQRRVGDGRVTANFPSPTHASHEWGTLSSRNSGPHSVSDKALVGQRTNIILARCRLQNESETDLREDYSRSRGSQNLFRSSGSAALNCDRGIVMVAPASLADSASSA